MKPTSIDSFSYHMQILDSFEKNNFFNGSEIQANSVEYMEILTGIPADGDGSFIGWTPYTIETRLKWEKWYKENKE